MSVELQYIEEEKYFRPVFIVTSAILALCYFANQNSYVSDGILSAAMYSYLMILFLVFAIETEQILIRLITLGLSLSFYVNLRVMLDSVVF